MGLLELFDEKLLSFLLWENRLFTFGILLDDLLFVLMDELVIVFGLLFEFMGLGDAGGEQLGKDVFGLLFHLF